MGEDSRVTFREIHLFLHDVGCLLLCKLGDASNRSASTDNGPGFLRKTWVLVLYFLLQDLSNHAVGTVCLSLFWLSNRSGILEHSAQSHPEKW